MSIQLHPEHGVNPTVAVCFFCWEDTGEVVLLGRSYKGKAPMRMVMDYNPCDSCKEKFEQGILFIEVTPTPNTPNQPPMYKGYPGQSLPYPTGQHWVLTVESVRRIVGNSETGDKIIKKRKALIDPDSAKALGLYNVDVNDVSESE